MTISVLDQIVFGRRESSGLVVLASSFDDSQLEWWEGALDTHIRLSQFHGKPPPPTALSYFRFGEGRAAVLRRRDEPGAAGRNASHALVGSADMLSPQVALGLDGWSWSTALPTTTRLERVDGDDVVRVGLAAHDHLRIDALDRATNITAVLACLLQDPQASVSIVGCPDRDRIPLLWALHAAASTYLAAHGVTRAWTFSTYETEHSGAARDTPEILFTPEGVDATAFVVRRVLIDLAKPPQTSPEATNLARRLLECCWQGSAPDLSRLPPLPVHPTTSAPVGCTIPAHLGDVPSQVWRHVTDSQAAGGRGRDVPTPTARSASLPQVGDRRSISGSERNSSPVVRWRVIAGTVAAAVLLGLGFGIGRSTAPSESAAFGSAPTSTTVQVPEPSPPHSAPHLPLILEGTLPAGVSADRVGVYVVVNDLLNLAASCQLKGVMEWTCAVPVDTSVRRLVVGYPPVDGHVPPLGSSHGPGSITELVRLTTG